jgi:hypothetical protein
MLDTTAAIASPDVLVGTTGSNPYVSQFNKTASMIEQQQQQQYRNGIKALDFCYSDDQTIRFNIIDAINLCVTVVAYATHAYRSNQMLIILDCLIPRLYFTQQKRIILTFKILIKLNKFFF